MSPGDPFQSRLVRVLAILAVAVPVLVVLGSLIWFRALGLSSQGVPLWTAIGTAALAIIGLLSFVVFAWWLSRVTRR